MTKAASISSISASFSTKGAKTSYLAFTSPEDRANYQALKEQYEDETLDYSYSKREITGQLELIITSRENDFPNLDEVTKAEYLDLVAQLDDLDKGQADYYRKQLA